MSAPATVPVTITPEAAARVAELGMQGELERMIKHARECVAGLRRVEVILEPPYDTGDDPYLTIQAFRPLTARWDDPVRQEWGRWKVTTFAPEVARHVTLTLIEGGESGAVSVPPLAVPAVLRPEAAKRIEELGMQEEFRQMLEHTSREVADLRRLEISLVEPYDTGAEPGVLIEGFTALPETTRYPVEKGLVRWFCETFPPEVREYFSLDLRAEETNAG